MELIVSTAQHVGRRSKQEDAIFVSEDFCGGKLFIVCDGLGGHSDGDWASQEFIELFIANFPIAIKANENLKISASIDEVIEGCINFCQSAFFMRINEDDKGFDASTTVIGCFILHDIAHFFSIGDSLLFITDVNKRKPVLRNLKHENSDGLITSAIGLFFSKVWIDNIVLEENHVILLASDGIEDLDFNGELEKLLSDGTPTRLAEEVANEILIREVYNQDNISIICIAT